MPRIATEAGGRLYPGLRRATPTAGQVDGAFVVEKTVGRAALMWNCAMLNDLGDMARDGDADALKTLLASLRGVDIPSAARRGFRDRELRRLADQLRGALHGVGNKTIAGFLAAAGATVTGGAGVGDRPPFDRLSLEERRNLEIAIRRLVRWCGTVPKRRQIMKIIAD